MAFIPWALKLITEDYKSKLERHLLTNYGTVLNVSSHVQCINTDHLSSANIRKELKIIYTHYTNKRITNSTQWSRVNLEKLMITEIVKKINTFHGT
jgi:hypothetical protein